MGRPLRTKRAQLKEAVLEHADDGMAAPDIARLLALPLGQVRRWIAADAAVYRLPPPPPLTDVQVLAWSGRWVR